MFKVPPLPGVPLRHIKLKVPAKMRQRKAGCRLGGMGVEVGGVLGGRQGAGGAAGVLGRTFSCCRASGLRW